MEHLVLTFQLSLIKKGSDIEIKKKTMKPKIINKRNMQ